MLIVPCVGVGALVLVQWSVQIRAQVWTTETTQTKQIVPRWISEEHMVVVKPEVHSIRLHSYSARRLYCVPFAGLVFLQANSGIVFRFRPRRTPSWRSISSVCLCVRVCIDEKFVPFFFVPLLGPRCRTLATFSLRLGYGTKIDFPGSGFRWLRAGFSHACFAFTPAHSQTVGRLSPRRPTLPRNRDRHEFLVCVCTFTIKLQRWRMAFPVSQHNTHRGGITFWKGNEKT